MTEKTKNLTVVLSAAILIFGFGIWAAFKPADLVSESERRPLEAFPEISVGDISDGSFMADFEDYATDQFPLRDKLRSLKAFVSFYVLNQKDMNGIYVADGYASKTEYPLNKDSLDNAAAKFKNIYDKYLGKNNVYYSVIPDKNYFLAEKNGYLSMDYDELVSYLNGKIDFMEYIDIFPYLEIGDYYKTDTHWKQEKITDVAQALAEKMGVSLSGEYNENTLDKPFYGVYYGQSALPLDSEEIKYLTNEALDDCTVYNHENGKEGSLYDMEKAYGNDPYELFLSGSVSLITIKNPNAPEDKRLVVLRDSFGSSITPLLAEGYGEVTVIDIRYISSEALGSFVDFEGSDVLFLYSTMVLNNSVTFK